MAKIPTVESTGKITDLAPTQRVQREAFAGGAKSTQEIGKAIADVAQKFEDLQTLNESTRAANKGRQLLSNLETEATNTPGLLDVKSYQERISSIREEAASGISLPRAKGEFSLAFERSAMVTEFNIQKLQRQRQIEQGQAELYEAENTLLSDPNGEVEMDSLYNQGVQKFLLSPAQKVTRKQAWLKKRDKFLVSTDTVANPELAKVRLLEGFYEHLDPLEVESRLNIADKTILKKDKELKELLAKTQATNELEQTFNLLGGSIDTPQIEEMSNNKDISIKYAEAMYRVAISPLLRETTLASNMGEAIKLNDEYYKLNEDDADKLRNLQVKTLIKYADGVIGKDTVTFLFNRMKEPFTPQKKEKKNILSSIINGIKSIFPLPNVAATAITSVLTKVEGENIPTEKIKDVVNEVIIKERVKKYPWISGLPTEGERRKFPDGSIKLVFPDGRIEDAK